MERRLIKTHKTRDIKRSPLVVSKYIVDFLKNSNGNSKVNDLYICIKKLLDVTEKDFMYAINFLYVLGKISYDKSNDKLGVLL